MYVFIVYVCVYIYVCVTDYAPCMIPHSPPLAAPKKQACLQHPLQSFLVDDGLAIHKGRGPGGSGNQAPLTCILLAIVFGTGVKPWPGMYEECGNALSAG